MTQIAVVGALLLPIVLAAVLVAVVALEEGAAHAISRTPAPSRLVGMHHQKGDRR
jgi:hypothetical protein